MLDKSKAIRKDKDKHGKKIYVFPCKNCQKELFIRSGQLSKHQGRCKTCSSKESVKSIQGQGKLPPGEAAKNRIIRTYKTNSTKRGLEWSVSEETLNILFNNLQEFFYEAR